MVTLDGLRCYFRSSNSELETGSIPQLDLGTQVFSNKIFLSEKRVKILMSVLTFDFKLDFFM